MWFIVIVNMMMRMRMKRTGNKRKKSVSHFFLFPVPHSLLYHGNEKIWDEKNEKDVGDDEEEEKDNRVGARIDKNRCITKD